MWTGEFGVECVFTITMKRQTNHVLNFEDDPEISAQSAQHTIQVMFLMAFAGPYFYPITRAFFNGKIGAWEVFIQELVECKSNNHPRWTMETKSIKVTKAIYLDSLVNKIPQASHQKFPSSYFPNDTNQPNRKKTIWIQQENFLVYVKSDDPVF